MKCTYLSTDLIHDNYYARWHIQNPNGAEGWSQVLVKDATNKGAPCVDTVNAVKNMVKI